MHKYIHTHTYTCTYAFCLLLSSDCWIEVSTRWIMREKYIHGRQKNGPHPKVVNVLSLQIKRLCRYE